MQKNNTPPITIRPMEPAEYQNGGEKLTIRYSYTESLYGNIFVASTSSGICHLTFYEDASAALAELKARFPNAHFVPEADTSQHNAIAALQPDSGASVPVELHVKCTDYQRRVWEVLLAIPPGRLTTYGDIARKLGQPGGSRAAGTAVGSNPVAVLIPCHRVVQSGGAVGGYRWGSDRKKAIIRRETEDSGYQLQINLS